MTLRFEIFWRETANWQDENRHVWSENINKYAESSDITACMRVQLCTGHSRVYRGQYREVKGRLFVSYESCLMLFWMGQPLVGCRNHKADVKAVREV